jgi:hypothetical protein
MSLIRRSQNIRTNFCEEPIAYFLLIRHRLHRRRQNYGENTNTDRQKSVLISLLTKTWGEGGYSRQIQTDVQTNSKVIS